MKPSVTLTESLKDLDSVETVGQLRRIASQMLLSIARKETSAADAIASAKLLSSISQNMDSEIKLHLAAITLREKGGQIPKLAHFGQTLVDGGTP